MSYLIQEISRLEDVGVGATVNTIFFTDNPSKYTFSVGINSLIFSCIFWGIISWYLNRVIVPDYGQALPFYFPFTLSYWFPNMKYKSRHGEGNITTMEPAKYDRNIPVEQVSDALRNQATEGQSIEIHDLKKQFKDKTAVDGLNLSMYSGQITALLGHNGAGKTTTINLLTGAMAPTSGYAMLAGHDVRKDLTKIRSNIGICLQHDCLFPLLTVTEHVQFFCRLKGVYDTQSYADAEAKVASAITDVGLLEKTNTLSKNLSGGMKRKLSVAMAFCGNSSVVILDEPTSGMDPFSRRFTWNVIRQYRQNRCIILTTHFMDEADILGDRIAIMAEGRLRCVGSSLFLKKTYGVGYQLTIDRRSSQMQQGINEEGTKNTDNNENNVEMLNGIVKDSVPEAVLLSNVGTELSFQLPLGGASNFVPMLEKLDSRVDNGTINSYGVSITTLDEVFQIIARNEDNTHDHYESSKNIKIDDDGATPTSAANVGAEAKNSSVNDDNQSTSSSKNTRMNLEKEQLFRRHLLALLKKRKSFFFRDKKAWCCTTILPSIFVLLGFILITYTAPKRDLAPLQLNIDDYNVNINNGMDKSLKARNPIPFNTPNSNFPCQPGSCIYEDDTIRVMDMSPSNTSNTSTPTVVKNETYYFCGANSKLQSQADDLFSSFTQQPTSGPSCSIQNSFEIISRLREGGILPVEHAVNTVNESSHALINTSSLFAATQYGAIYFTHDPNSRILNENVSYADAVYEMCVGTQGDYVRAEECENYKGIGYVIGYNYTALHATPMYQAIADEAIIREALNNDEFKISATIHPLPITSFEDNLGNAQDAFIVWFLIVLSFPFIAGAYATFVVTERQSKAKHLQTVAGVKPVAYWLSTLLWDMINYQTPLWIVVILMHVFDAEILTTTNRQVVNAVITILFLYGPASACFAYVVSFGFTSPSLCNVVIIVSGFLIGFGGPLAVFILRIIGLNPGDPREDLQLAADIVEWVCRALIPSFCLGNGLFKAINIDSYDFWLGGRVNAWDMDMLLIEVIFLLVQIALFFSLAILIDILSSKPTAVSLWRTLTCRCRGISGSNSVVAAEDADVLAEEERIKSGGANSDLIVLSQLTKVYDTGKVAVNSLSLGIPHGQCFGLLGINGAGKTTTMGMLTAEFPPTSGDATLAGYSVCQEPEKTRRRIGYCPQFDAHFENLTGREHIELYASIKGVPTDAVKDAAANKLAEVGLSDADADRVTSQYSGGMKRRLSLACATIGQPQIVFLDECSTGVDPVARREIWQLVSDMVSGDDVPPEERTSVILTTHSMEECEALCPRIGIMANGVLRCLGSAQHLKTKFGRGYQVEMTVNIVNTEDEDYSKYFALLVKSKGVEADKDEEAAVTPGKFDDVYFNVAEAQEALRALTDDEFLSSKLKPEDETGGLTYKEATSVAGIAVEQLASFATTELRMRALDEYIRETYQNSTLRERQDLKVRYEVGSDGVRITQIFAGIEEMKVDLKLADYGVSQTSLEQVFNMHAAEAERLKYQGES